MKPRSCVLHVGFALLMTAAADAATFIIPPSNITALKVALAEANSNGEDDVINLAAGGLYQLTSIDNFTNGPTGLPVLAADGGHSLTINGNGAGFLRSPAGGTPEFRILQVGPNANVTLSGLNVVGGLVSGPGGGIYNDNGSLTLAECTIVNNNVSRSLNNNNPPFGPLFGGGLYNFRGSLVVRRTLFRQNIAIGNDFTNPTGEGAKALGGAIMNAGGTVTVEACTFSANSANSPGGMSANSAGGAIANSGTSTAFARVRIASSTFSGNAAVSNSTNGAPYVGTSIYSEGPSSTGVVEIGSSIIAGLQDPMLSGASGTIVSHGYNLSNGDGNGFLNATADRTRTDPQLRPLANNGGFTHTHALRITSPAIDTGQRDAVPEITVATDQRGVARTVDYPGFNASPGGDGTDVGAYEKDAPNLVVTTTADHDDGGCTAQDCTLREAINAANAQPNLDTIGFAPAVIGSIDLGQALPEVSKDVEIAGPGADVLTVRRNSASAFRILTITNLSSSTGPEVSIVGLTLNNGQGVGSGTPGGCIYNDFGALRLLRCVLSGNTGRNGAVIMNFRGTVDVTESTVSGNTSSGFAGAFFNNAAQGPASITLTNSTIAANTADRGGAIYNAGATGAAKTTLLNCTLSDNSAPFGVIYNDGASGNVTLRNTILKAGASSVNFTVLNGATVTSQGNNISSDAAGGDSTTGPGGLLNQPGDQRNTDPQLDTAGLRDNGGTTPTIALQSNSAAVDSGNTAAAPTFDQREFVRVGIADIGAFEFGGAAPTPPPTPTPAPTAIPTATPTATPVATPSPNRFLNISTRLRVETGENVLIGGFIVTGSMQKRIIVRALGPSLPPEVGPLANPLLELYDANAQLIASNDNWQEAPNRQEIVDSTIPPSNDLESAILRNVDLGAYTAVVRDVADGEGVGLVEVYDLGNNQDSRLANISTRGRVQTGDNVMIGGLITTGSSPQKVIIRAIGPSLGIAGQLEDPLLELFDGNGNPLGANNNWKDTQQQEIEATTIPPPNDFESAIVTFLPPAAYTAVVRGVDDTTGVALVEVYALQ